MTAENNKLQVLAVGDISSTTPEYQEFSKTFEVIHYKLSTREVFIADLKEKFTSIVAIWLDHIGFYQIGGIPSDLRDAFPQTLKVVCLSSIGYGEYHGEELRAERGIILCNNPAQVAIEQVADVALYHVLNAFRYLNLMETQLRTTKDCFASRIQVNSDSWNNEIGYPNFLSAEEAKAKTFSYGHSVGGRRVMTPKGKHALIVGMGSIGSELAKRLMTLGMYVHYMKKSGPIGAKEAAEISYYGKPGNNAELTYHESFESFAAECDIVINCLPQMPTTNHYLNEKRIKMLKPGCKIVNVGRGSTIDTEALITHGLKTGHITYFGTDVYEKEPVVQEELTTRYDVCITPHIGSSTIETIETAALQCMDNIKNVVLYGGKGYTTVN